MNWNRKQWKRFESKPGKRSRIWCSFWFMRYPLVEIFHFHLRLQRSRNSGVFWPTSKPRKRTTRVIWNFWSKWSTKPTKEKEFCKRKRAKRRKRFWWYSKFIIHARVSFDEKREITSCLSYWYWFSFSSGQPSWSYSPSCSPNLLEMWNYGIL